MITEQPKNKVGLKFVFRNDKAKIHSCASENKCERDDRIFKVKSKENRTYDKLNIGTIGAVIFKVNKAGQMKL